MQVLNTRYQPTNSHVCLFFIQLSESLRQASFDITLIYVKRENSFRLIELKMLFLNVSIPLVHNINQNLE
jgi:hypothetical protein